MLDACRRYVGAHPRGVDAAVALVLFGCAYPAARLGSGDPLMSHPAHLWPAVVAAAVACPALLWCRTRPRTALAVTAACAVAVTVIGYLPNPVLLGPVMVAAYALAVEADRAATVAWTAAVTALVVLAAVLLGPADHPVLLQTAGPASWVLLPAALGRWVRLRRAYLAAMQTRAEYAERTREQEAQARTTEERLRIARDLHDVVAHHLALANAQATTAAHLLHTRPDQAGILLTDLTGTTSAAIRDLHTTVGLLRRSGAPDPAAPPDLPPEPAPGLARLNDLVATLGTAGLAVTVHVDGPGQPLSPGVDLTAFRIIQEALTNVARHAATGTAQVRLRHRPDLLTITVTDDGPGSAPPPASAPATAPAHGGGFGLIGMRERVRSLGGHLRAGPRPEGGFAVTADLPLRPGTRKGTPHDPAPEPVGPDPSVQPDRSVRADPRPARRRPGAAAVHLPHAHRLLPRPAGRR